MKEKKAVKAVSDCFTEDNIIKSDNRVKKRLQHPHHKARHRLVFWFSSVLIGFTHLVLAVVIIPILIVVNMALLGVVLAILALMTGLLYTFSLSRVQHLRTHHNMTAGLLVPVVMSVYVVLLVFWAQHTFGIGVVIEESMAMGAITGGMFTVPYLIQSVFAQRQEDL